jgi:NADPH:quinone reductase-like Zn-dependent oxidoreductase
MKAYEVGAQRGLDSLRLSERPEPTPGPTQAVVRVRASALNHRDLMMMNGRYMGPKPENHIPLSDGAGDVIAVGAEVANVAPGDRVTACHFTGWINGPWDPAYFNPDLGNTADGLLAEQVVVPAACLVKIPDSMSFQDACTLPVAALTAWHAVNELGRVKSSDTVLTLGTGGVSVFAVQLASIAGAQVAITSSSDEKLAKMRALGADITTNYRSNPEWEQEILEQTGGRGVDIVVETGGFGTLEKSLACAAPNARVGIVGGLAGSAEKLNLFGLLVKNVVLKGITSGSQRMLGDLVRAVDTNNVKPIIDRVFPFDEAPAAYRHLESASHIGKVVIDHG